MEHVNRVLNHARRLEASIESSVQIHFAAMAHRTSAIMRTLTIITAIFMPLTLITGVFGMNFVHMPLLNDNQGFWIIMGAMFVIVLLLIILFQSQRYFEGRERARHLH
jgi:Mg2+ and Co2+ transporter CorA